MNRYNGYLNAMLSLLAGIFVFVFFFRYYPYHLHYQEQFQLFLFRSDYFVEKVTVPGGLADYLSRFFVQFFYHDWLGALILAFLLTGLQCLVAHIAQKFRKNNVLYILTFLPSFAYLYLFCDENYMLAGLIGLLLVLSAVIGYQQLSRTSVRVVVGLLSVPVIYWFTEGGVWLFIGLLILSEGMLFKQLIKKRWILYALSLLLLAISLPLFAKYVLQYQYPLSQLIWTMGLHRFWTFTPYGSLIVWIITLLVPVLYYILPTSSSSKKQVWLTALSSLFVFAGIFLLVRRAANWDKEEAMGYDYHVRMKQWDKVLDMAKEESPYHEMGISCLNLALAKKGQLGNRMFYYTQTNTKGLIPPYMRDFTSPLPTNEIYYHLGFINSAERHVFEAMEAIPDKQKSVRCVQRLAETNLINGQYEVARKYLHTLQYTLFYRSWATDAISYLYKEEKINKHKEWGPLRANRFSESLLFRSLNLEQMLVFLLQANPANRMALDYLMAYPLLDKDLQRFYSYFQYFEKGIDPQQIPIAWQEALLYIWSRENNIYDEKPWPIPKSMVEDIKKYAQTYTSGNNPQPTLTRAFGNTYWYYIHFGGKGE